MPTVMDDRATSRAIRRIPPRLLAGSLRTPIVPKGRPPVPATERAGTGGRDRL